MKKKITSATIVLAALFAIVCFAVRYENNHKSEYEEWLDAYAKAVWGTSVRTQAGGTFYCIQHGGDYSEAAEAARAQFLEEVAANISVTESMGLTYEEFLSKMEKLDEEYDNSGYFSTNAETLYELSQKGQYRESLMPAMICLETVGATKMKGDYNSWNAIEEVYPFGPTETYEEWRTRVKFVDFDSSEEAIGVLCHRLEDVTCTATTLKDFAETWDLSVDAEAYAIQLYQQMQRIENL